MIDYLTYDVFTGQVFGGNPLAVIPDAAGLSGSQMQAIAREFNYCESTFVLPPSDPAHTARVRIFTPERELPFAGHPTIGTAVALSALGRGSALVLELGVGPIEARVDGDRAEFDTQVPLRRLGLRDPTVIAACLGLGPARIVGTVEAASLGLDFVFAEVDGPEALEAISVDLTAFRSAAAQEPDGFLSVFAWAETETGIAARMFAPLEGIPEDPATGSACATLGALLAARRGAPQRLTIRQGVAMGRPSEIGVAADGRRVTVSGQAVRVMEGRLTL